MALSNMTIVSDGNLEFVSISFNYLDRSEINVYFDSVPTSTWAWVGDTNQIKFTPKVPNGVTVLIARTTDASDLRHTFSEGAAFTAKTLDEDLRQVLHIVQEAKETNLSGIFYSDIDMNSNKITNLAPGSNPSDAVTFQQLQDLSPDAGLRQELAKDYANTGSGLVGFRQDGIGAIGRTVESKLREINLSVTDFGAIGDWNGTTGTDNLAAFNACFAQAMVLAASGSGVKITIPRGRYRLTDTWDIYRPASPRRDIIIAGEDQLSSILVADFAGAGKALIRAVDQLGATRASPTSIRDLGFSASAAANPCPVYVDILGLGESRIERVRFGTCNNTAMRIGSAQNVRMDDIVSFYGGHHFNYKATEGIRFTTTGGGTNIIASAMIFSAGDVGKLISLYPSATENYIKYEIASYVSPTEVTVVGTTISATSVIGRFQPAQCSISNGSNSLTANSSCFAPSDVGRVIYIRRARAGAWGDALLRATITSFISGSQVTLDKQATNTVADEFFTVPVIDLYRPSGVGVVAAPPNDVKINKLHIENFSGVGLIAQDVLFHHITEFKIHGEATPLDTFASASHMWLDDFGGELSGEFDGVCPGDTRFYACNFNDLATLTWLATRRIRQETIFKIELFPDQGGYVNVSNLNTYTASVIGTQGLGIDANYNANNNDPRLVFSGFINMLGDAQRARIHTGRNSWFSPRGQLTPFRSGVDAVLDPAHVTWNGTPPSSGTNLRYRWEQIAGLVNFSFRVEYATPGTGNSGVVITLPANMPLPVDLFGGGGTEIAAAAVTAAMATATSGVAPSLTRSWMEADGAGGFKLMCALNSGSIAAAFATISGFYWAAQ